MKKSKIGTTKLINNYRKIANNVDNEIGVYISENVWYCEPENNDVFVATPKDTNKGLQDFIKSIDVKLPSDKKYLLNIIPVFMWSFLHEIGHLQTEKKIYKILLPYRKLTDFLSYHFSHIQIIDKLTSVMYFNLIDEVKATKWAINYVIQNENKIVNYSKELEKIYSKYFKKVLTFNY